MCFEQVSGASAVSPPELLLGNESFFHDQKPSAVLLREHPARHNHTWNPGQLGPPRLASSPARWCESSRWEAETRAALHKQRISAQTASESVTTATQSMNLACWPSSTDPEFFLLFSWSLQTEAGGWPLRVFFLTDQLILTNTASGVFSSFPWSASVWTFSGFQLWLAVFLLQLQLLQ